MTDVIAILWWWILVALIGLLAWPLAFRLLRFVPDRGYSATRPLGLLLGTYAWWLLGSLGFLNTSLGSILIALALTGGLSAWLYHEWRADSTDSLRNWLRRNLSYVLTYECLFLLAFASWAYFRAHCPGINHTEKPMEFAFLNAILRSPGFPPNDPWLAGYGISYYYMGYVIMALLARLSGTAPSVAYNVAHALWFALFATGGFGAAYNLIQNSRFHIPNLKSLAYGLLAAVMLVVMGNLGGTLELAHQNGLGSASFWQWLDVAELSGPPTSGGGLTPQRGGWWWWRASRVINDYKLDGNSQHNDTTIIDEFPQFSFILGDMHPHVLALPFALLAITLAFNVYVSRFTFHVSGFKSQIAKEQIAKLVVYAVVLGGLGFLNTWDYPIYLALVVAAYGLGRWREAGRLSDKLVLEILLLGVGLGITGYVLYLPFYLSLAMPMNGLVPNLFNGTRLSQFFIMFGPFLVIGACFLLTLALRTQRLRTHNRLWLTAASWTLIILVICILLALLVGAISPKGRMYLEAWRQHKALPGLSADAGEVVLSRLAGRLLGTSTLTPRADGTMVSVPGSGPWLPLVLLGAIVLSILIWSERFSHKESEAMPESGFPAAPFAMLLFVTGAALALSLEFIFLADAFGTRMNTVFKFYYQVWALWSVAAAYGAYYVIESQDMRQDRATGAVQAALIAVLILAGLCYPIMAIPGRIGESASPTLDGSAYLARENPDEHTAIQWLNANVHGAPTILEAPGLSFQAHTSRVSAYTGLPTLLGWSGHESQWRKSWPAAERERDIQEIYNSRSELTARNLLDKYGISYIYVGSRERAQYSPAGLAKFEVMAEPVFRQGAVAIYRVRK
jgi:YYY domain-containing protein